MSIMRITRRLILLFLLAGCSSAPPPLPEYTPGEARCLARAEAVASAGLMLCGKGNPAACPKERRDEIEAEQLKEIQICLEQY